MRRVAACVLFAVALAAQGPDVAAALVALRAGGDTAAATAAEIRHEWVEVPAALLDGIADDVAARTCLLRELAVAPRPSLQRWVLGEAMSERNPSGLRALALAAADRRPDSAQATMLVQSALAEDVDEGLRTAIWLLGESVADGLMGRLHAALLQPDVDIGRLLPFFDRLSPKGRERLVGLVATLPPAVQAELVRYFVQNDVPAYRERAAAALDGTIPLDTIWLARAEELLDGQGRVDRLCAVLRDAAAPPALAEAAFRALVAAHRFVPDVLDFAGAGAGRREWIRRVVEAGVEVLPVDYLLRRLGDDASIAGLTAAALVRRPTLEPELEQELARQLRGLAVQGPALPYATALLHRGSPAVVQGLWPSLRTSPVFADLVDALARRTEPWVRELLVAEVSSPPPDGVPAEKRAEDVDAVRLALVGLGDAGQLARLVARAPEERPAFVRRCVHHANGLATDQALALLDAARVADEDLAIELIAWAATVADPKVQARLLAIWREPEFGERQMAALHGLAQGPARAELCITVERAITGTGLDERSEAIAYELLAAPDVVPAIDDLAARLVLVLPLGEPAAERERAERWPDGSSGFPLVAAAAQSLRGSDPDLARSVFTGVAATVAARGDRAALSRQRLLVLWRTLVAEPELQRAVGEATAGLMLQLPAADGLGDGPAHWFAAHLAVRTDRPADAAAHARLAVTALLRSPEQRATARLFLGDRDPAGGRDPWAGLATWPHLLTAQQALAAGDVAAARTALATAKDLAGRDAATLAAVTELSKDSRL